MQSEGGEACALAAGYDMKPDKWQRIVLEGWLATDSKLQWAASDCGCAVPRQNGKNAILEFTELYLAAILGMKILHTAHEVKTCRKHFLRMNTTSRTRASSPNCRNWSPISGPRTARRPSC